MWGGGTSGNCGRGAHLEGLERELHELVEVRVKENGEEGECLPGHLGVRVHRGMGDGLEEAEAAFEGSLYRSNTPIGQKVPLRARVRARMAWEVPLKRAA